MSTSLRLAFASPPHFNGFYKNRTQKKATREQKRLGKNRRGQAQLLLTKQNLKSKPRAESPSRKPDRSKTPKPVLVKRRKPQNAASRTMVAVQVSAEGGKSHANRNPRIGRATAAKKCASSHPQGRSPGLATIQGRSVIGKVNNI